MFSSSWDAKEQLVYEFLQNSTQASDLYKALHIDKSPKTPIFDPISAGVMWGSTVDIMVDYTFNFDIAGDRYNKILVYAGSYD